MNPKPARKASSGRRRGNDGPVEAVERIVPRRQLTIGDGDFVVTRTSPGLSPASRGSMFELLVHGLGAGGERFTTFELAVARGSELAARWRARLFYADAPGSAPHLLADCRPARSREST
jgi:hypothetical protein